MWVYWRISSRPPVTMWGLRRLSFWTLVIMSWPQRLCFWTLVIKSWPLRTSSVTLVTISGPLRLSSVAPVTMSWPMWVSSITPVTMSWPTSEPDFCVVWLPKRPASGWRSLWESSSFVPRFSTFVFRNVSGTVPECVRTCGFKRNSSNLYRAPKMRDTVLLNSWESFSVTLPSISSKTCVIYSSLILGTYVSRDWPFLGFSSCISLVTAANFRLFLNVAIFLERKCYAVMKTDLVCIC